MNPYTLSDGELEALLGDDAPCGDATTLALGIAHRPGQMIFRARQAMTVCGVEEAGRMGALRGLAIVGVPRNSGDRLQTDEEIIRFAGTAAALHQVWKTAQTLIEYLSGIASCTAEIVAAARRGNPLTGVACTRKNFPGTKCGGIAFRHEVIT